MLSRFCSIADGSLPNFALCIKPPFAQLVVEGHKTWEIRSFRTQKREKIAIAMSGSRTLIGEVDIVDCICLDEDLLRNSFSKHRVRDLSCFLGRQLFAWVLKSPKQYSPPKPYEHPPGAISWVCLGKALIRFRISDIPKVNWLDSTVTSKIDSDISMSISQSEGDFFSWASYDVYSVYSESILTWLSVTRSQSSVSTSATALIIFCFFSLHQTIKLLNY